MDLSFKQAQAEKKLRSKWIRALQTTQKTTTLKRAGLKMAYEKKHQKVALRREKGSPTTP